MGPPTEPVWLYTWRLVFHASARALAEGLPYQTLISSLLHKYAAGRFKEV